MNKINGLPPFKRLCVTIGNLPSSYVDSMSYYECIMWLCKFLQEKVIPAINENAEAVNELINWFNNLDVQDEIDHKLDEMTESGELQEIITSYLQVNGVLSFNTLNDLVEATNIIDGSSCYILGQNTYNDGKSAFYKVRELLNTDVVDGFNIVALDVSETLIAERLPDYYINSINEKIDNDKKELYTKSGSSIHISFDDVELIFTHLLNNEYTSMFEEPMLHLLKELHDTYGACFSLYVFTDTFNTMTNDYKNEFKNNSKWLKIGFHAKNSSTNMSTTQYPEAKNVYNTFVTNVINVCGTNEIIDRIPRLGNYAGNYTALGGLSDANSGIYGVLDADDDRISYDHTQAEQDMINTNYEYFGNFTNLFYIKTNIRLEESTNLTSDLNNIINNVKASSKNIEIFTHEYALMSGTTIDNTMKNKIIQCCEWANDNHIPFNFVMNKYPNLTGRRLKMKESIGIDYNGNTGIANNSKINILEDSFHSLVTAVAPNDTLRALTRTNNQKRIAPNGLIHVKDSGKLTIVCESGVITNLQYKLCEYLYPTNNTIAFNQYGSGFENWVNITGTVTEINLHEYTKYVSIAFRYSDDSDISQNIIIQDQIIVY